MERYRISVSGMHMLVLDRTDVNRVPSILNLIIGVVALDVLKLRSLADIFGAYIPRQTPVAYTKDRLNGLRAEVGMHMRHYEPPAAEDALNSDRRS